MSIRAAFKMRIYLFRANYKEKHIKNKFFFSFYIV